MHDILRASQLLPHFIIAQRAAFRKAVPEIEMRNTHERALRLLSLFIQV